MCVSGVANKFQYLQIRKDKIDPLIVNRKGLKYVFKRTSTILLVQAKSESERDEWMQLARNLVRHNPGLLDRFHPGVFAGGENYLPFNVNFCFRKMALLWRNAKELLGVPGDIVDTQADQVRTSSTSSSH